jgi:hypothetical protein
MGTEIEGALGMTGMTTGGGIQRALSDNGNANRYGNSKSAYRRELRERVQEFKEFTLEFIVRLHPRAGILPSNSYRDCILVMELHSRKGVAVSQGNFILAIFILVGGFHARIHSGIASS